MNANLQRAILHYQQNRLEMAEQEFRQALAAEPQHPMTHAFLAMCLTDRKQFSAATTEAQQAVHLGPDWPIAHYALAYALSHRNHLEQARAAIQEAIRLEPEDANNWSLLAAIEMDSRNWTAALEAAEKGLEQDPEDDECTNLRAMALVNLGRRDEAGATIESALRRDPENAATHANMGWTLLHQREPNAAMEHFREALRIDPEMNHARAGIVEAMKARNFIYRYLLMYFLWMARLSGRAQWGVIIGLYVLSRVLKTIAKNNPAAAPYIVPVLVLYMVFALLTWIGEPLFNLLLRFNRFGRLALSREQIVGANWLAVCLGGGALGVIVYFLTNSKAILIAGVFLAAMTMPVAATFRRPAGWPRRVLTLYTLVLAGLGAGAAVTYYLSTGPLASHLGWTLFSTQAVLFVVGWLAFQWVANALNLVRVKR